MSRGSVHLSIGINKNSLDSVRRTFKNKTNVIIIDSPLDESFERDQFYFLLGNIGLLIAVIYDNIYFSRKSHS